MTQLDKAGSGKVTEAMLQVSEYEGIHVEEIRFMNIMTGFWKSPMNMM